PLVDDFHRRHAAAHDALLAGNVIAAHLAFFMHFLHGFLALAGHAFQQGIDLFLGQKGFTHDNISCAAYWMMKPEKCTLRTGLGAALRRLTGASSSSSASTSAAARLSRAAVVPKPSGRDTSRAI